LRRADDFAGRLVAHLNARGVEVAFSSGITIGIDVERVIWTSLHAGLTADAALVVKIHNPVGSAKKRDGGTNFNARSVIAMIAAEHREVSSRIWVAALFDILHPCAIHAHRDVMLFFARHRAGVTADATVLIDDKSVAHFIPFESEYLD
jgi:hypothetical protein